jgi:hypothetical protein
MYNLRAADKPVDKNDCIANSLFGIADQLVVAVFGVSLKRVETVKRRQYSCSPCVLRLIGEQFNCV